MEQPAKHNLYSEIQLIARKVHARCNGARSADGKGFGRGDVSLGAAIALAEPHYWSDGLAARGVNMLLRYHRQIPEDMERLRQLEAVFPDATALAKVPPVVGLHHGRLALLSGQFGADKEEAARLKKVLKQLGFGGCDDDMVRALDCDSCDPVNYDEPLVALETAGWCILPEAKGAFGSYLARLKDTAAHARWKRQQEAEASRSPYVLPSRTITLDPTSVISRPSSAAQGRIREDAWMPEGQPTVPALWFDIPEPGDLSILQDLLSHRLRRDPMGTRWWILPSPSDVEKAAICTFAMERGWKTKFAF